MRIPTACSTLLRALAPSWPALILASGPLLAQVPRPPQLPPRFQDQAYVETLLERYDELTRTDAVVETERARAKVHYYLTYMEIADRLPGVEERIEQMQAEIDRKRSLGQDLEAQRLESELEKSLPYRDALRKFRSGADCTSQELGLLGDLAIKPSLYRLTPDADGKLRPDGTRARREPQRATLAVYSRDAIEREGGLRRLLVPLDLEGVVKLPEDTLARHNGLPESELDQLVALAREASEIQNLISSGEREQAQALIEKRWEWVMAWPDEPGASEPAADALTRPPALPPRGGDRRYVEDVVHQFDALSKANRNDLTYLRAQARMSWYKDWKLVHDEVARRQESIARRESELEHLLDLGSRSEAATVQAAIDRDRERLEQCQSALAGGPFGPLIEAKLISPVLWISSTSSRVEHPVAPVLGFYGEAGITRDKQRATQCLQQAQSIVIRMHDELASEGDKAELREFSRELGRCLELLEAGDVEELVRIFDQRWQWILDWGDDTAFERVEPQSLSDLIVPEPAAPVTQESIKAIKARMKTEAGKALIERNRIDAQATFASVYQSARLAKHTGPLTFDDLYAGFRGSCWGVGWADVRAGGDRARVTTELERVEERLATWLQKTKHESDARRARAAELLELVRQARSQYAAGDFLPVMEHLKAIRTWILEGSGFELH